ncbi:MAG: transposase [Deferrisomatales bacterium]|nr:transposase [Deferrisomatales bacterium]
MPRQARLDLPGLLQHVIVRGIERRRIFFDDEDREDFVGRLSRLLVATKTQCFAWALLPNHFHLLLRPTEIPLASFMRRLLTGYAVTFNLRYKRSGHLFQNRYKSIVCDEEEYLLALVRYIGLNPLRVRLVSNLDELDWYPWCGHAATAEGTLPRTASLMRCTDTPRCAARATCETPGGAENSRPGITPGPVGMRYSGIVVARPACDPP